MGSVLTRPTAPGMDRGPIIRLSAEAGQMEIFRIRTDKARHPALAAVPRGHRPGDRSHTESTISRVDKWEIFPFYGLCESRLGYLKRDLPIG